MSPVESLLTGGSPFLGLLACLPIMAQSVAPQKSTSPPSNSACLLDSGSSAIVRLYRPEHPSQSADAYVECRRTSTPVIQTDSRRKRCRKVDGVTLLVSLIRLCPVQSDQDRSEATPSVRQSEAAPRQDLQHYSITRHLHRSTRPRMLICMPVDTCI
jgi:hypothetical protein